MLGSLDKARIIVLGSLDDACIIAALADGHTGVFPGAAGVSTSLAPGLCLASEGLKVFHGRVGGSGLCARAR